MASTTRADFVRRTKSGSAYPFFNSMKKQFAFASSHSYCALSAQRVRDSVLLCACLSAYVPCCDLTNCRSSSLMPPHRNKGMRCFCFRCLPPPCRRIHHYHYQRRTANLYILICLIYKMMVRKEQIRPIEWGFTRAISADTVVGAIIRCRFTLRNCQACRTVAELTGLAVARPLRRLRDDSAPIWTFVAVRPDLSPLLAATWSATRAGRR